MALIRFIRYMLEVGTALSAPDLPLWFFQLLGHRLRRTLSRRALSAP